MLDLSGFEHRKQQHLKLALDQQNQSDRRWGSLRLIHDALPEINFEELTLPSDLFFISGMTAGHPQAHELNLLMAQACEARGWILGLGSNRREMMLVQRDHSALQLRQLYPRLKMISNLGISQLIELNKNNKLSDLDRYLSEVQPWAIAIHLNALQELIQPEGTPQFRGGVEALHSLSTRLSIPVIVKETGSGLSELTLKKIKELKLLAVDVSGTGGTHWGRIEGKRAEKHSIQSGLSEVFENWGEPTPASVLAARKCLNPEVEVWASGGIRSGLDAALMLALGAKRVGLAKPVLEAALQGNDRLIQFMSQIEQELKAALFLTGSKTVSDLNLSKVSRGNENGFV